LIVGDDQYIRDIDAGEELFDLATDPGALENIVGREDLDLAGFRAALEATLVPRREALSPEVSFPQ